MTEPHKRFLRICTALVLLMGLLGIVVWPARPWLKLRLAAWHAGRGAGAAETRHGLKPRFKALPPGWVAQMCQPMDSIWAPLGLKGTNYYSFGGPAQAPHTYSARSDPSSRLYQAWFGVYIIAGRVNWLAADGSVHFPDLSRVAERDQNDWLSTMGDEHPETSCVAAGEPESLEIAGKIRPLIKATLRSHSDLSPGRTGLAAQLGMPKPEQWNQDLEAYHDILLTGFFSTWYEPVENATIVVYANAAGYQTKDGRAVDYFPSLQKDLISMIRSVEFERYDGAADADLDDDQADARRAELLASGYLTNISVELSNAAGRKPYVFKQLTGVERGSDALIYGIVFSSNSLVITCRPQDAVRFRQALVP
jgi:hypothetical protein